MVHPFQIRDKNDRIGIDTRFIIPSSLQNVLFSYFPGLVSFILFEVYNAVAGITI